MSFSKPQAQTYGEEFARQALISEGERLLPLIGEKGQDMVSKIWPKGLESIKDFDDLCAAVSLLWRSVE